MSETICSAVVVGAMVGYELVTAVARRRSCVVGPDRRHEVDRDEHACSRAEISSVRVNVFEGGHEARRTRKNAEETWNDGVFGCVKETDNELPVNHAYSSL